MLPVEIVCDLLIKISETRECFYFEKHQQECEEIILTQQKTAIKKTPLSHKYLYTTSFEFSSAFNHHFETKPLAI